MNSVPRYEILSYPINTTTPMYGSAPAPNVNAFSQIANNDISNSYIFSAHNHTGTHIDAPKHFVDNGRSISDYSLDELIFNNPSIVKCQKDDATLITPDDLQQASHLLQTCDSLLLYTAFGRFRGEEKYRTHNPGIAPETILFIRKKYPNIRCIGIDNISISSFQHRDAGREAHKTAFIEQPCLGKPLLLIEDMRLDIIADEKLEVMFVFPWLIDGIDSAPCSILVKTK